MTQSSLFSISRWWAIVRKEFLQLRRDRVTFAMIVGIPIIQMALFGYAINTDPKHLDTAIISADNTDITRTFIWAMKNSSYFKFVGELPNEAAGREALDQGKVLFVVNIPAGFTRQLLRHERPALLVEADATDPTAAGNALFALNGITQSVIQKELTGPLASLAGTAPPFQVQVHRLYNPDGVTQYNVVPGLMGVILTLTMVMMTGLAITRERERGTMENLLAMPATPIEVMTGNSFPISASVFSSPPSFCLRHASYFMFPSLGISVPLSRGSIVRRREFDRRHHALFTGAEPTAGGSIDRVLLLAQYPAFRLHVPFQRMPTWAQWPGNLLPR